MKNIIWKCKFDRDNDPLFAFDFPSNGLNLYDICKILLLNRGITDKSEVLEFLNGDIELLHDPFLMKDMHIACERIKKAINSKEKIAVYGDYDVDGVSATAVMIRYLVQNGMEPEYYIPKRSDGYGLSRNAILNLFNAGATLLITVDTGITAINEIEFANDLGLDVIITDHHQCGEVLPEALAIVNPKRRDCDYPFDELAGVGVVFKIICALIGEKNLRSAIDEYCQLVAIGTIADVMPLRGENRVIVKKGLELLERTANIGLKALIKCAGAQNREINASMVSFVLAPRINAAGRVDDASSAVELFITNDREKAESIALKLCEHNRFRQGTEAEISAEAKKALQKENITDKPGVLVLSSENWHQGVIGVVASKISEKYFCPTILISLEDDVGKGSGRSVGGFNLFKALEGTKQHLLKFGGHELAAGLSIRKDKIEDFKAAINEYSKDELKKITSRCFFIECKIFEREISLDLVKQIKKMEPFGAGNSVPLFCIEGVKIADVFPLNDKHTRLHVLINNTIFNALYFNKSAEAAQVLAGDIVDLVFYFNINRYRNKEYVQFIIKQIRLSKGFLQGISKYCRIYDNFKSGFCISKNDSIEIMPSRDDFVAIYRYLLKNSSKDFYKINKMLYPRKVSLYSKRDINYAKAMLCLDVMEENALVSLDCCDEDLYIKINKDAPKINLCHSKILIKLKACCDK